MKLDKESNVSHGADELRLAADVLEILNNAGPENWFEGVLELRWEGFLLGVFDRYDDESEYKYWPVTFAEPEEKSNGGGHNETGASCPT